MSSLGHRALATRAQRLIARACYDEEKTTYALGKELGRSPGGLEGTASRMVRDGVLEPVVRDGTTAYRITVEGRLALDRLEVVESRHGLITPGQRLMVIATQAVSAQRHVLAAAADNPAVMWAVRLDGAFRLLLSVSETDPEVIDHLEAEFTSAGAHCVQGRADKVMTRQDLGRYAGALESSDRALTS
jgi:hypothetical protein